MKSNHALIALTVVAFVTVIAALLAIGAHHITSGLLTGLLPLQ